MHDSTRRAKRLRRPPSYQSNDDRLSEDELISSSRHRQGIQPDSALRGVMLVALIVVTIVLYILLWELERSSFANRNATQSAFSSSMNPTWTQYPHAVVQGADDTLDNRITPGNAWPITHLPEEHDADPSTKADDRNDDSEPSSFDATYCGGACRFLLPVRIGEQESKARIHFSQLLVLSRRLNRTIVLPNVGKSRMSACSQWHFGAYYDTNGFVRRSGSSDSRLAIDFEEFATWVDKRPAPPSAFAVFMGSLPQNRLNAGILETEQEDDPFIVDKTKADPKILSCLEIKLARLRSSLPETTLSISFSSYLHKMESDTSTRLAHFLSNGPKWNTDADFDLMTGPGYDQTSRYSNSSQPSLSNIDVLVLDYDLRHPLFAASAQPLHYAPALYDLAERLSDNLGPFFGVHWRMENVPVQNLAWCAASLVNTLRTLLQDDATGKQIRYVWLATDHPRPLGTIMDGLRFPPSARPMPNSADGRSLHDYAPPERSSTFKALTSEHDDAIGILADAFQPEGDLDAWTLTDLAEQLRRYPYVEGRFELNQTLLRDPGVFGILDKLVIVQAKVFVSGSIDCSRTSSFSKQVIDARQDLFEVRGKVAIRNVVEYFGEW